MNKEDIIDCTFDKIITNGFDVNTSPLPHKVVILIVMAQGIIDNGGGDYFFESPFEGNPDYQQFVNVYIEIGAKQCAEAIKKAIALNKLEETNRFTELNDLLYERSESNYKKLRAYVEINFA